MKLNGNLQFVQNQRQRFHGPRQRRADRKMRLHVTKGSQPLSRNTSLLPATRRERRFDLAAIRPPLPADRIELRFAVADEDQVPHSPNCLETESKAQASILLGISKND